MVSVEFIDSKMHTLGAYKGNKRVERVINFEKSLRNFHQEQKQKENETADLWLMILKDSKLYTQDSYCVQEEKEFPKEVYNVPYVVWTPRTFLDQT
jgi:hypothetical protein